MSHNAPASSRDPLRNDIEVQKEVDALVDKAYSGRFGAAWRTADGHFRALPPVEEARLENETLAIIDRVRKSRASVVPVQGAAADQPEESGFADDSGVDHEVCAGRYVVGSSPGDDGFDDPLPTRHLPLAAAVWLAGLMLIIIGAASGVLCANVAHIPAHNAELESVRTAHEETAQACANREDLTERLDALAEKFEEVCR